MIHLVIYTLAAFGFAYIVGFSKLSLPVRLVLEPDPPRKVDDDEGSSVRRVKTRETFTDSLRWWLLMLLECPACLGFWTGAAYVLAFGLTVEGVKVRALELALFTCGSNLLLGKWAGLIKEGEPSAAEQ